MEHKDGEGHCCPGVNAIVQDSPPGGCLIRRQQIPCSRGQVVVGWVCSCSCSCCKMSGCACACRQAQQAGAAGRQACGGRQGHTCGIVARPENCFCADVHPQHPHQRPTDVAVAQLEQVVVVAPAVPQYAGADKEGAGTCIWFMQSGAGPVWRASNDRPRPAQPGSSPDGWDGKHAHRGQHEESEDAGDSWDENEDRRLQARPRAALVVRQQPPLEGIPAPAAAGQAATTCTVYSAHTVTDASWPVRPVHAYPQPPGATHTASQANPATPQPACRPPGPW